MNGGRSVVGQAMNRCVALAVGLVLWSMTGLAHATVVGCRTFVAGKVVINHCDNHDYFPSSQPFQARLEARGLERLRVSLVRAKKLPDMMVLVEYAPWRMGPPRIAHRAECRPDVGDYERTVPSLGACIHVAAEDLPRGWSTLRTALVAATTLSAQRPSIPLDDLAAVARRHHAGRYLGIAVVGRRYASVRSPWAVRERWRDGRLRFQLMRRDRVVRRLAALPEVIATAPRWSADGTTVAFATLGQVSTHRLTDGTTHRFDVAKRLPKDASHLDIRIRWRGAKLEIAADTSLRTGYRAWRWTPEEGTVELTQKDGKPPF